MGFIRPATPGFLLTAAAAGCLAVVSFCVPYLKSVYFMKATINQGGITGAITFGTLGYCLDLNGVTTCSKPAVGYELDINSLVGNNLPVSIPKVVVKWLTDVLILHVAALILAVAAALFGLLAHVREMSMTCCSTFLSGLAATVALVAFIFDLALFFVAKARINAIGSASIGSAVWLTLAAWVLLFFSGCFYTIGRCCVSNRKRSDWNNKQDPPPPGAGADHEQMRLDAVKAEADRKARQKMTEGGLPAFYESQPLTSTAYDDGNAVYSDKPHTPGGYVPGNPGERAVDGYYDNAGVGAYQNHNNLGAGPSAAVAGAYTNANTNTDENNRYPPSQHRQPSTYAASTYSHSAPQTYPAQQYAAYGNGTPPVQPPMPQSNPYLDPYAGQTNPYLGVAGHASRGTSYHSAVSHQNEYSQYDPYEQSGQANYRTPDAYVASQYPPSSSQPYTPHVTTPPTVDGYGANVVPPLDTQAGYFASGSHSAAPTSPKGPRSHRQSSLQVMNVVDEDSPPGYEPGHRSPFQAHGAGRTERYCT
ncbi:unnamed protein product [Mycena citricolor]|uniref:Pali-domain-containing protein n=1 Tax=Mycena citricolor TaxID=2018698 RepID=A0AAD2GV49_9AGAR|nr:unnamed protein product [Mycena citricolor]